MRKLYFISQYFDIDSDKHFGGVLIRKKQIELLSKYFEVHIIMPNKKSNKLIENINVTYIPYFYQKQICDALERLNILADKEYYFSKNAIKFLENKVTNQDIIFCTTGGTLETLSVGYHLKNKINCKYVINFQDPINYTSVNGLYVNNEVRFKRNNFEKKYLSNCDLIITSSDFFKESLIKKYSFLNNKNTINNYYGYFYNQYINENLAENAISLMYAGLFGKHQSVEIIAENLSKSNLNSITFFIGNYKNYKPILPYISKFNFIELLPHKEFMRFVAENINVGIVSLTSNYLAACVPSKIFEYINLGLPIIGILPNGDAKKIINDNQFGKVFGLNELKEFEHFLKNDLTIQWIENCRNNILKEKHKWHMDILFNEVIQKLQTLSFSQNNHS